LLEPLGINETEIIKPDLFPCESDRVTVEELLKSLKINDNHKFIIIAPGSVWYTKRFPEEKFVKLLDSFTGDNINIVLIGSEDDHGLCERILSLSNNKNIYNLAGELSLLQTAELIRKGKLLVTNDSAPLHIANSVKTDVIAIFGATVTDFGFYPYGKNDVVFEINGLDCRPCSIHGSKKCPVKTFDCMIRIDEEEIYRTVLKMIS
jgi:heptosyltransferase-2